MSNHTEAASAAPALDPAPWANTVAVPGTAYLCPSCRASGYTSGETVPATCACGASHLTQSVTASPRARRQDVAPDRVLRSAYADLRAEAARLDGQVVSAAPARLIERAATKLAAQGASAACLALQADPTSPVCLRAVQLLGLHAPDLLPPGAPDCTQCGLPTDLPDGAALDGVCAACLPSAPTGWCWHLVCPRCQDEAQSGTCGFCGAPAERVLAIDEDADPAVTIASWRAACTDSYDARDCDAQHAAMGMCVQLQRTGLI